MKKAILIVLLASVLAIPSACTQKESLFNGKNLDGWTIYGTEKWYVEDGLLVCESGPDKKYGYLATNKHYHNFELNFRF